jgi:hypothetical protein
MTHPHDTPPTPDALAQVLTPLELLLVDEWLKHAGRYDAVTNSALSTLLPIIERLAVEVARMRLDRDMASDVLADMNDKLRART